MQLAHYFVEIALHALCNNFSNADSFTRGAATASLVDCNAHAAGLDCALRRSSLLPYMIRAKL